MWSKDFILLIQGQAVSCLGSTLYSVVAGLWAFELTGSTMTMSVVFSATHIARLVVFPFAGVIVDRFRRRDLIIFCDLVSGMSMLAVAASAATGSHIAVWALSIHSIVTGACSGIFNSSINTLMLTTAKKEHFVRANSIYGAIEYCVDMIGQSIAGMLYLLLGAPLVFLFNGITFLFSAISEAFISKGEKPEHTKNEPFIKEALEGILYIIHNQGILLNLCNAFLINFSFGILKVALIPWMLNFGREYYGFIGSWRSAGIIIGTFCLAIRDIPERKRYSTYFWCQIMLVACIALSTLMTKFLLVAALFCIAYINQYIFNSLQRSAVFISAPDEIRGKVICAIQALAMGFSAFGNLAGGFICELVQPQPLVFSLMLLLLVGIVAGGRQESVKALF